MNKNEMPIILLKENEVLNFIIILFSVLQKESYDKEITFEGNKFFIRKRIFLKLPN